MTTKLNFSRDVQGVNAYGMQFCDDKQATTLSANTAQSFVVPSNFENWILFFSFSNGGNVFVRRVSNNGSGDAAVPGSSFASTNSELNPAARSAIANDKISFITADTTDYVQVSLYAV